MKHGRSEGADVFGALGGNIGGDGKYRPVGDIVEEKGMEGNGEENGGDTEKVNHPDYYNRYSVEVIEMARRIWGDEAMRVAAEITAFIYRMRAGVKPDNPVGQDLDKEEFWLNYAKWLGKDCPKEGNVYPLCGGEE